MQYLTLAQTIEVTGNTGATARLPVGTVDVGYEGICVPTSETSFCVWSREVHPGFNLVKAGAVCGVEGLAFAYVSIYYSIPCIGISFIAGVASILSW